MTDREMLEMAAKAAGIVIATWSNCQAGGFLSVDCMPERRDRFWNPLAYDGDALRLAVKLGIGVLFDLQDEKVTSYEQAPHSGYHIEFADEQEPSAATRRAIVRAAAVIGRAMP